MIKLNLNQPLLLLSLSHSLSFFSLSLSLSPSVSVDHSLVVKKINRWLDWQDVRILLMTPLDPSWPLSQVIMWPHRQSAHTSREACWHRGTDDIQGRSSPSLYYKILKHADGTFYGSFGWWKTSTNIKSAWQFRTWPRRKHKMHFVVFIVSISESVWREKLWCKLMTQHDAQGHSVVTKYK